MLLMNFPYKIPVGLEVILFTIARYYTSHEFPIQNTHRSESDIFTIARCLWQRVMRKADACTVPVLSE